MKHFLSHLNLFLILVFMTTCLQGCEWLGSNFASFDGGTRLVLTPEGITTNAISEQTANVIKLRLDYFGIRNKEIKIVKDNKIEISLPKTEHIERAKKILARKGIIEFKFVNKAADNNSNFQQSKQGLPSILNKTELLEPKVLLDNSMIKEAEFRISSDANEPYLQLTFNDIGEKRFFEVTAQGIGRRMAIVMDGQIVGAPVIREAISGGKAMVNLPFSEQEVKDLEIVLNSGPYPVKMNISEVHNIAPAK